MNLSDITALNTEKRSYHAAVKLWDSPTEGGQDLFSEFALAVMLYIP